MTPAIKFLEYLGFSFVINDENKKQIKIIDLKDPNKSLQKIMYNENKAYFIVGYKTGIEIELVSDNSGGLKIKYICNNDVSITFECSNTQYNYIICDSNRQVIGCELKLDIDKKNIDSVRFYIGVLTPNDKIICNRSFSMTKRAGEVECINSSAKNKVEKTRKKITNGYLDYMFYKMNRFIDDSSSNNILKPNNNIKLLFSLIRNQIEEFGLNYSKNKLESPKKR